MWFCRQEYGGGLPCPPPGNLPHPGTEPMSPASHALQMNFTGLGERKNLIVKISLFLKFLFFSKIKYSIARGIGALKEIFNESVLASDTWMNMVQHYHSWIWNLIQVDKKRWKKYQKMPLFLTIMSRNFSLTFWFAKFPWEGRISTKYIYHQSLCKSSSEIYFCEMDERERES